MQQLVMVPKVVALFFVLTCPSALACAYGRLPGVWSRHSWPRVPGSGTTLDHNRLDNTSASVWLEADSDEGGVPFGSAWTTLDTHCQLENYISPLLSRTSPLARNVTIVFLGDSLDAQILDFACAAYWRRGGKRAFAYVHSHRVTNYCHIGDGGANGVQLTLVQMYMLRSKLEDDLNRIESVKKLLQNDDQDAFIHFDGTNRAVLAARAAEVATISARAPDLVVMAGVYWPLHKYSEAHRDDAPQILLPRSQVVEFITDTSRLVHAAREAFPHAHVVMRNSPQIRTDCQHGSNVDNANKRTWGRRMWVDQLNNAMAQVAKATRTELVDAHAMASGWQPSQVTSDDVHPRAFFQFELLNVYINMIVKR
jgi:hypothetical protein